MFLIVQAPHSTFYFYFFRKDTWCPELPIWCCPLEQGHCAAHTQEASCTHNDAYVNDTLWSCSVHKPCSHTWRLCSWDLLVKLRKTRKHIWGPAGWPTGDVLTAVASSPLTPCSDGKNTGVYLRVMNSVKWRADWQAWFPSVPRKEEIMSLLIVGLPLLPQILSVPLFQPLTSTYVAPNTSSLTTSPMQPWSGLPGKGELLPLALLCWHYFLLHTESALLFDHFW